MHFQLPVIRVLPCRLQVCNSFFERSYQAEDELGLMRQSACLQRDLNEQSLGTVGSIFSSKQKKNPRQSTVGDGQSCMILMRLLLILPFFSLCIVLQGRYWCTASWEWAARQPWCWPTSWSTTAFRSNRLCRNWSRRGPFTPTGISWRCCWIWIFRWQRKRNHARSCDPEAFSRFPAKQLCGFLARRCQAVCWPSAPNGDISTENPQWWSAV